jgi:hypothetical protein
MSDDGRRTKREQWLLFQTRTHKGEPWHTQEQDPTRYRSLTQSERIDRLERDLRMGKYADPIDMHNYDSAGGDDAAL